MVRAQPPELGFQDGHNLLRRVKNQPGNAAKPGSRDDNIHSTFPENLNSTSGKSTEKHPQSTKGANMKQLGQANHGSRPNNRFDNGAKDLTGQILDRAHSTSVDTEVIETIAPGKFSIRFVMCQAR